MREAKKYKGKLAEYTITQFGALEGQRVLLRLSKMMGPALGRVASGRDGMVNIGPFVEELFESLDDAMVEELAAKFAKHTMFKTPTGKGLQPLEEFYDDFFSGQYAELMFWFRSCLEANYSDFLEELKKQMAKAEKEPATNSPNG